MRKLRNDLMELTKEHNQYPYEIDSDFDDDDDIYGNVSFSEDDNDHNDD